MSNKVCRNPECEHPRAEHRSRFLSDINDYEYQECSVFECPCGTYVGDSVTESISTHDELVQGLQQCCRACGSDLPGHMLFGAECVAICESNWKKLRALEAGAPASQEENAVRER